MGSEQGGNKGVGVGNCQIMPNEKDCILGLPCIKHVGWPVAHFFSLFFSSLSTIFHLVTELKKIILCSALSGIPCQRVSQGAAAMGMVVGKVARTALMPALCFGPERAVNSQ